MPLTQVFSSVFIALSDGVLYPILLKKPSTSTKRAWKTLLKIVCQIACSILFDPFFCLTSSALFFELESYVFLFLKNDVLIPSSINFDVFAMLRG